MSSKDIKNKHDEPSLATLIRKLSAFYEEGFGWVQKRTLKKHKDLFGDIIEKSDFYFRLPWGLNSYYADLKLSEKNMELVCNMFFQMPASIAEKHADWIIDKRFERMRDAVNKLPPLNSRLDDPRFYKKK